MIRRIGKAAIARLVRLACRVVSSVWDDPAARDSLGRLHALLVRSDEENAERAARTRYSLASTARWGSGTVLAGDGSISIGENSYLGERCHLVAHPQSAAIRIGRGCAISHNVQIRTEEYRTDLPLAEARKVPGRAADILIADDVWIGANVFITAGVTIERNAIVGANSVVTRDVAAGSIVGGVPARVIRSRFEITAGASA